MYIFTILIKQNLDLDLKDLAKIKLNGVDYSLCCERYSYERQRLQAFGTRFQ